MRELTRAEEQIMHVLWELGAGFVKDIIEHLPDPKPAYNTVSTIVRILERKGFVSYHAYGKTHQYYPLVSKDEYKKHFLKRFVESYFGNSLGEMVSFFAEGRDLGLAELEELNHKIRDEIQKQRKLKDE